MSNELEKENKLDNIINFVSKWDTDERISWNEYFLATSFLISSRSPDKRLKVGCVLVKDNHVISVGYNGFLPKVEHKSYMDNGHEQATVHAEQNCISDCSRRGVATDGAIAYITHYPCINCFKMLVASGIKEIKYLNDYKNDKNIEILLNSMNNQIVITKIN